MSIVIVISHYIHFDPIVPQIHILHYFLSTRRMYVNVYEKIHRHDLCSQLHRVCALLYFGV